MNNLLIRKYWN